MPNVVLVHTPDAQARGDFEIIAERIEAIGGGVRAFVADNGQANDEVNRAIAADPTLVFSPVGIHNFVPARGKIYQGRSVDKISQYKRLVEVGIPTPRTKVLAKGDVYSEREWGKYVVVKPLSDRLQSSGDLVYRIAAAKLSYDLNVDQMFDRYNIDGGSLVQECINTGPYLEYHRVLTLFGEPLYAMTTSLIDPIDLDQSMFPTGTLAVATQSYSPKHKRAEMITDTRYLDLARSAYAAFPERALQAIDIIRCHDTDRLYVLEMNLGGNTWHFSSKLITAAVNSPRKRLEFRKKKIDQFGAFDVAARVLASRARTEGL